MKNLDRGPLYEAAEFYDAELVAHDHEFPFYVARAQQDRGPVLKFAGGTGQLTLPSAAAGVPIVGVDLVPAMVDRARAKATTSGLNVEWHVADDCELVLGKTLLLAFIATNALQYLHDAASLEAFLRRAAEYFEPGGPLVVDVFNPSVAKLSRSMHQRHPHKTFVLPDGRVATVDVGSECLADAQMLHHVLAFRVDGRIVRSKDVRMRCIFPEELLALCRAGGFEPEERFGDYDRSPFGAARGSGSSCAEGRQARQC
ncbi:MAG: methyltransferase domain-containing protein [Deltaproteobacteria bacterium]|nr:methyltransferase domain-containing protein [Deltaproteobacteria bacterium]